MSLAQRPDEPGLFVALAPMDGVTDWVYRDVLTSIAGGESGISQCVSEFVRVTRDPAPDHVLLRHCPELARGGTTAAGVPVFVQLLGGKPVPMAETARRAAALGAPGIDINFGCPAKTVNNHDGGASILRTPARVEAITRAIRDAVPPEIPVTVKVRVGWEDASAMEAIAHAAEDGGGAWLTVHGRTRVQGYKPPVDWEAIGRAREAIQIPVVANGDLNTPEDFEACGKISGCNAFMVGRGSMGRPGLFRRVRGWDGADMDLPTMADLLADYVERLLASGAPERASLGRLKQWLRLGAPAHPRIATAFDTVKVQQELEPALAGLNVLRGDGPGRRVA